MLSLFESSKTPAGTLELFPQVMVLCFEVPFVELEILGKRSLILGTVDPNVIVHTHRLIDVIVTQLLAVLHDVSRVH